MTNQEVVRKYVEQIFVGDFVRDIYSKMLIEEAPTADELRKKYPNLGDLLKGEFSCPCCAQSKFNFYSPTGTAGDPMVVSRVLFQNKKKDPTIGLIFPGQHDRRYGLMNDRETVFEFNTGDNEETMIILDGTLKASVNDCPVSSLDGGLELSSIGIHDKIVAPAGSLLKLTVKKLAERDNSVLYYCEYRPKEK